MYNSCYCKEGKQVDEENTSAGDGRRDKRISHDDFQRKIEKNVDAKQNWTERFFAQEVLFLSESQQTFRVKQCYMWVLGLVLYAFITREVFPEQYQVSIVGMWVEAVFARAADG